MPRKRSRPRKLKQGDKIAKRISKAYRSDIFQTRGSTKAYRRGRRVSPKTGRRMKGR